MLTRSAGVRRLTVIVGAVITAVIFVIALFHPPHDSPPSKLRQPPVAPGTTEP